jgi:S1-C subfamily serine protease
MSDVSDQDQPAEIEEPAKILDARELYRLYGAAMVAIVATDKVGDERIGSAFHIGVGIFVTARHVVEGQASCRLELDRYRLMRLANDASIALNNADLSGFRVEALAHPDPLIDVAVFSVPQLAVLPAIPLGAHLDDWIVDHEFVLAEVLVLGFPPIPLSARPVLVAARGQINAVVDLINTRHVHFVVSATPRGGFSGGVVLSVSNFALGVITKSLIKDYAPEELGYLTVLTVEPILECLAAHRLLPRNLALEWDGLFTSVTEHFGNAERSWAQAWLTWNRDGHVNELKFACPGAKRNEDALQAARNALAQVPFQYRLIPKDVHVFNLQGAYDELESPLERVVSAVRESFIQSGLQPVDRPATVHRVETLPPL